MDYVLPIQAMSADSVRRIKHECAIECFPGEDTGHNTASLSVCLWQKKDFLLFFFSPARPNFLPLPSSPTGIVLSHWFPVLHDSWTRCVWRAPVTTRTHYIEQVASCGGLRTGVRYSSLVCRVIRILASSVMDSTPVSLFGDPGHIHRPGQRVAQQVYRDFPQPHQTNVVIVP
jgi:hypothetical protein